MSDNQELDTQSILTNDDSICKLLCKNEPVSFDMQERFCLWLREGGNTKSK